MSEIGEVLNLLSQEIIPEIAPIVFGDSMNVIRSQEAQDDGGASGEAADTVLYQDVPVQIKRRVRQFNANAGDKQLSTSFYDLTFPVFHEGEFMTVTADCGLVIQERGETPERVFAIEGIHQNPEGTYTAFCNEV